MKRQKTNPAIWNVYILQCRDGTLYTGITIDFTLRLQKHSNGKGAKYTRGRGPFIVLLVECYPSKGAALKRELEIKSLSRIEKLALAAKESNFGMSHICPVTI